MAESTSLRIAVVGPTHPYKGGVSAHTTALAHELTDAGHEVILVSWSRMFPKNFYPSEEGLPDGKPDIPLFPRTIRTMSWRRPDTWVRTGLKLQDMDAILIAHVMPIMVPGSLALLRAAGVGRTSSTGLGPRAIAILHNVLPHERRTGDEAVMETFLRRVDAALVHTPAEARAASALGAEHVVVADLPPHLPQGDPIAHDDFRGPARLLSLGTVRDYKGIDLLMRAMMRVPDVTLTVAGEMWADTAPVIRALAEDRRLAGRVAVHGGYVPAERLPSVFATHDVLTLTYRTATASQNVTLGHQHGLPVLATDVGNFAQEIRDGVDGLIVPPNDEDALVAALERLRDPDEVARLRAGVRPPDLHAPWARYIGAIEALASADSNAAVGGLGDEPVEDRAIPALYSRARTSLKGVVARSRPRVDLHRNDFPDWVRATDVLCTEDEAHEAWQLSRDLRLPLTIRPVEAWCALGALAAVLRVRDDGNRSALLIDESGVGSPYARWARAIGFAPLELELTGGRSSVSVLDVETASLDVITRLHPNDCEADEVVEVMNQASWALRTGGLLSLTMAVGPAGAEGCVGPSELRGIVARADDVGFVLVGDLDGDVTDKLRRAAGAATDDQAAFAVARLTFRRR